MQTIPQRESGRRHYQWKYLVETAGVYLIYRGRKGYVGSSKNLRQRLTDHYNTGTFAGWKWRVWIDQNYKVRERELMEALLDEGVELLNKNSSRY